MWFADQAIRSVAMILSVNRSICCHGMPAWTLSSSILSMLDLSLTILNMFLSDSFFCFFFSSSQLGQPCLIPKQCDISVEKKKVQIMFSVRYKSLIWIGFFKAWFPVALFLFLFLFLPSFPFLINRKIRKHLFFVCCCFSNCCFLALVFLLLCTDC